MIVLRRAQLTALNTVTLHSGRHRLVDHCRRLFPEMCASLEDAELDYIIDEATAHCAELRMESEGAVKSWLNMMFTFGRGFHQSPTLPWPRETLAATTHLAPEARLRTLYARAIEHEAQGGGIFAANTSMTVNQD